MCQQTIPYILDEETTFLSGVIKTIDYIFKKEIHPKFEEHYE